MIQTLIDDGMYVARRFDSFICKVGDVSLTILQGKWFYCALVYVTALILLMGGF